MKKEKVTDAVLAENMKRAVGAIKSLEKNVAALKADIIKGHVNHLSVFCVIGNEEANRINSIIIGSSNDMTIALANALDEKRSVQETVAEALMIVA